MVKADRARKLFACAVAVAIAVIGLIYVSNGIVMIRLQMDIDTALEAERLAGYKGTDPIDVPISWFLEDPYVLLRRNVNICDYARTILAMQFNSAGETAIDRLEASLTDRSGHGYYTSWKLEEAIAPIEKDIEDKYGINLLDRPLDDNSFIEEADIHDEQLTEFTALRTKTAYELSGILKKAGMEYSDQAIKDLVYSIFIRLVSLGFLTVLTFIAFNGFIFIRYKNPFLP